MDDEFNRRFIDLSISNSAPNRYVGINSLAQLDSVLNKFSASLKTIELTLDSLEVNKSTIIENVAAERIWLDKFELLESDVDLQREFHTLINEKCNTYLNSLDNEEDAIHFTRKLDEINYRWNSIRLRIIALRNYLETNDEQIKQLLISIRELIDWISKSKIQLNNPPILAGDVVTAAKQKNDHRIFFNKIEDKRPIVESTLIAGKQFLINESAVENDYTDYDLLDCIRREIKKLSEKWTDLCQHAENKERILEDIYLKLNSLQKQIEDASLRLHTAELNKSKFVPINEITQEKIAAHLAELKTFKERIFPLQNNIEQVNSLANLITQCNVPLSNLNLNHLEELNTRWKLLKLSIEERQKALEKSAPSNTTTTSSDYQSNQMLNLATVFPYERLVVANSKVPYYINHNTGQTEWNHPKMTELLNNLAKFNDIRYAAYRLALKLRVIQKKLGLDLIYIHNLNAVFDQHALKNDSYMTVPEMINVFQSIYNTVVNSSYINTSLCIDLNLNWLLNLYDTPVRKGTIRMTSFKIALIVFCRATIDEKYLFMYQLVADSNGLVDEQKLMNLFQNLLQIPTYLGEIVAFGGQMVEFSVRSCLERSNKYEIEFRDFLCWTKREPQSLVWLAVFHRIIHSEHTKHLNVRCSACRMMPIQGLRYKCLKCLATNFCQSCFFYGNNVKGHKITHPMQEYSITTTTGENVIDFTRIICNKFKPKNLFMKRNYYSHIQNAYMNDYMQNGFMDMEQQLAYQQQIQMQQQQQLAFQQQMNQVGQLNPMNSMNQMNQINPTNQLKQMIPLNQVSPINPTMNQNLMNNQTLPINQLTSNVNTLAPPFGPGNQITSNQLNPINSTVQPQIIQQPTIIQPPPIVNSLTTPLTQPSIKNQYEAQPSRSLHLNHYPSQSNSLNKNAIEMNNNHADFNNEYYMINSSRSPARILDSIESEQREELESIIAQLEEENRGLQMEYDRLKMEKLNAVRQQANSNLSNMMMNSIEEELNNNIAYIQRREDALAQASALKHYRDQLEARMEILEEHNRQLIDQLSRLRTMLNGDQALNGHQMLHNEKTTTTTSILKNTSSNQRSNANKSIHFQEGQYGCR